jgi:hypothetical protein
MLFPASDQHGSPIAPFIVAAVLVGFLLGILTIWRPRIGITASCVVLPVAVVGIVVWFAAVSWDIPSGLFIASVPCVAFFLTALAALICIALPGYLIRTLISRQHQ